MKCTVPKDECWNRRQKHGFVDKRLKKGGCIVGKLRLEICDRRQRFRILEIGMELEKKRATLWSMHFWEELECDKIVLEYLNECWPLWDEARELGAA